MNNPPTPAWYEPLNADERDELLRLVEKAAGVRLQLPKRETPAAYLFELAALAMPHVRLMESLVELKPRSVGTQYFYDPRQKKPVPVSDSQN